MVVASVVLRNQGSGIDIIWQNRHGLKDKPKLTVEKTLSIFRVDVGPNVLRIAISPPP